jgi:hypothetical protein
MRGMAAVHSIAEEFAHPRHRGFVPIPDQAPADRTRLLAT